MRQSYYDMRSAQNLVEFKRERKHRASVLSLQSPRGNEWSPAGVLFFELLRVPTMLYRFIINNYNVHIVDSMKYNQVF